MKKLLIGALSLLSLSTLTVSKRAEAGLMIGLWTKNPLQGALFGAGVGVAGAGLLVAGNALTEGGSGYDPAALFVYGAGIAGGIGAILDVDTQTTYNLLFETYKNAYPFIDNPETLYHLTLKTEEKIKQELQIHPHTKSVLISFTIDELEQIFSGSDVTQEQMVLVFESLK